MELAGLSCATAIARAYTCSTFKEKLVLICCGPGNNGGDGLVCARHLKLFGYKLVVYYPKRTDKPLYHNLTHQCKSMGVEVLDELPNAEEVNCYGLMVDALFGFSFKPPVRPEFQGVVEMLKCSKVPVVR